MISLMATSAGLAGGNLAGFALICAGGAAASTVANLTDYHIFLLLLRHHRIAKIRHTRAYHAAAKWFSKGPFTIMLVFNIILIPVDVVRMLSAVYGYHRMKFAAANFIGRLVRYATFVYITVALGTAYEWIAPLAFLGLAFAIALFKIIPAIWRKVFANKAAQDVSQ
jgi:membrane protein YqaA with SNARE-associated domain